MNIQILTTPLLLNVHGFSGIAADRNYVAKAFELMDKMWKVVKSNGIKNKGKNIWIYESNDMMFAGVELEENENGMDLEKKSVQLDKYAYYKHIGPYQLIKESGQKMAADIKARGLQTDYPYIEIYGHWIPDETKLETELITALRK
jgi:effector-binding domain-containing protein